jgi:hypothetical protein
MITSVITNQKAWFAIQSPQSCGIPMADPPLSTQALTELCVSVAMMSS